MSDVKNDLDQKKVGQAPQADTTYRYYVLVFLVVIYSLNFIDRQLIVILQESIKAEMGLTDGQLGMMSGLAFAMFYVICGIPIARWADRGNRRNIIYLAVIVWSLMTALTGMAQNFIQILLARIGVGVGEAGCSPPAHSMISDLFADKQRATALAIYSMGIYIGMFLAYTLGGWASQYFGWRTVFFVVGIPGVMLAVVFRFTVKEPVRTIAKPQVSETVRMTFMEVIGVLAKTKTFVHIAFAAGIHSMVGYGIGNWMFSYLLRNFEMEPSAIGIGLGISLGIGGAIGTFMGGFLSDKLSPRDSRWPMWVIIIGLFICLPIAMFMFQQTTGRATLIVNGFSTLFLSLYLGPVLAVSLGLVKSQMRAMTSAVLFFVINIIGLGLGPTLVGFLSDNLQALGVDSLGYAMMILTAVAIPWASWHYYLASKHYVKDMANMVDFE